MRVRRNLLHNTKRLDEALLHPLDITSWLFWVTIVVIIKFLRLVILYILVHGDKQGVSTKCTSCLLHGDKAFQVGIHLDEIVSLSGKFDSRKSIELA